MPDYTDGNIFVDYKHSDNAAEDLVQQTKAIDNTLDSLNLELNELSKTWKGSDAEAYHAKQAAWDGAVKEMETMLGSHAQLLNEIVGNYKFSENSLTQLWQEVQIGR